jgi:hypothetical protein
MKKLILSIVAITGLTFTIPTFAHGNGGCFNCFLPFVAGSVFGAVVSQPRYYAPPPPPVYYYPSAPPPPVYYYPQNAPVYTAPQLGRVCELRSEMINGQLVQGNFCHD